MGNLILIITDVFFGEKLNFVLVQGFAFIADDNIYIIKINIKYIWKRYNNHEYEINLNIIYEWILFLF